MELARQQQEQVSSGHRGQPAWGQRLPRTIHPFGDPFGICWPRVQDQDRVLLGVVLLGEVAFGFGGSRTLLSAWKPSHLLCPSQRCPVLFPGPRRMKVKGDGNCTPQNNETTLNLCDRALFALCTPIFPSLVAHTMLRAGMTLPAHPGVGVTPSLPAHFSPHVPGGGSGAAQPALPALPTAPGTLRRPLASVLPVLGSSCRAITPPGPAGRCRWCR